jgi:hypothetical protein
MALFTAGKFRISIPCIEKAAKQCQKDHGSDCQPIITDFYYSEGDDCVVIEFEYDVRGFRAGYGIDADGNASCFYD